MLLRCPYCKHDSGLTPPSGKISDLQDLIGQPDRIFYFNFFFFFLKSKTCTLQTPFNKQTLSQSAFHDGSVNLAKFEKNNLARFWMSSYHLKVAISR